MACVPAPDILLLRDIAAMRTTVDGLVEMFGTVNFLV